MEFRELSDEGWKVIELLPLPRSKVGGLRADDITVLNGVQYVLMTGCKWMDMPAKYGSYKTAWKKLKRCRRKVCGIEYSRHWRL